MIPEPSRTRLSARRPRERGSVLITAMVIAIAVGTGLVGYLNLSKNALKLSQRTYYLSCASSLAEAGLEEAVYAYRLVDGGTAIATAWTSWSLSGGNATLTLPTFNCSQNAVGTVKVHVTGYDGTVSLPSVVSQATITPLDGGPPIKKTFKVALKKRGAYNAGIVTSSSLSLNSQVVVDSFNSNPTGVSNPTRVAYSSGIANSNGHVVALGGTVSLGNNALIKGNLLLGAGVTSPSPSQVTGSIVTNYTATYPTPTLPTVQSGGGWYGLWSLPAVLPRSGDTPAADGRYYYYPALLVFPLLNLTSTTITAGRNVTLFCASVGNGLTLGAGATAIVWTGNITTSGDTGITNPNWAGALQFYSWGTSVTLGQNPDMTMCIYAPLATVTVNGGGATKNFTGSIIARSLSTSAQWKFHFDESLSNISTSVGTGWSVNKWYDLQGTGDAAGLSALTGGFLY